MKVVKKNEGKKRRIKKRTVLETNRNGAWYEKNQRKRGERGEKVEYSSLKQKQTVVRKKSKQQTKVNHSYQK